MELIICAQKLRKLLSENGRQKCARREKRARRQKRARIGKCARGEKKYDDRVGPYQVCQASVVQWLNCLLPRDRPGFDSRPMHLIICARKMRKLLSENSREKCHAEKNAHADKNGHA